ncbi:MAG TPA: hypothetical protein VHC90_19770 [Bryobacteraceae bacterium]|nr:hypothetical protein [Bryobacteraceae bacterium]
MTKRRGLRIILLPAACAFFAAACLAQTYSISTVAGGSPAFTPALAASTSIGAPEYLAIDQTNDAVYFTSGSTIYKLTTDGLLTQVAGTSRPGFSGDGNLALNAQLSSAVGLAIDANENLYIADTGNNRIRRIDPNGIITTVAGGGVAGFSGDNGAAVSAQLSAPSGVAVDANGNLFIADTGNHRIRKVTPTGIITTVAGNGTAAYAGDGGQAVAAQLSAWAIALDSAGDLFIGDVDNLRIRKVTPDGVISTVAAAAFGTPFLNFHQLTVDRVGDIFVADTGNSVIREVASGSAAVSTVAGSSGNGFFGDGFAATVAGLAFPRGVAFDKEGDMLIADSSNHRIRIVGQSDGKIATVAGTGNASYSGDGGAPLNAQFYQPKGLAVDAQGNLYIADTGNNRVREIANGAVTTVAGNGVPGFSGDGAPPQNAQLNDPESVAVTPPGALFIADTGNYRVRELGEFFIGTAAGNGNSTAFSAAAIALDGAGNLFVSDSANHVVREVSANGAVSTIAGDGFSGFAGDDGPALSAHFSTLAGIAADSSGDVFVVDAGNQRVRKISANGTITTVAGNGTAGFSGDGGLATSAELNNPSGIAVDSSGNLFIADTGNNRIREVSASGTMTTIAGNGIAGYSGDGGAGVTAALSGPAGIAIGKSGAIYFSDTGNNAVRLLTPGATPVVIASVVDAGSESATPLSAGKIVVIYGSGLGPDQLVVNQPVNNIFGQQLAGTTVSFRGIIAPIYYTSATQVAAIVPYEISGSASVPVVVSYQGAVSVPFNAQFAVTSPGFFTANASGAGQLAAINVKDGTLNSAANPVKIGDYIELYATGEGPTSPGGVDGKLAPLTLPIPAPTAKITATVGGQDATVAYAGAVPGVVAGLMQVNVQIPADVTPGGYVPVVLQAGDNSTVDGAVWIAVSQ